MQTLLDVKIELQEIRSDAAAHPSSAISPHRLRRIGATALASVAIVVAAVAWLARPAVNVPPMRTVPITSLKGWEHTASFAPDGEQVAFDWEPEPSNVDIYVTMLGSGVVRRLTTDPAADANPSWSPDGQHIAFVRRHTKDTAAHVHVMSALGGSERKVSDLPVRIGYSSRLSWSRDSGHIAAARAPATTAQGEITGIHLISTRGGEPRPLTEARAPAEHRDPAFSPDGHRLAFLACNAPSFATCDVMVVQLDAGLVAAARPRRLTSMATHMLGLAWTRDGANLIVVLRHLRASFISGVSTARAVVRRNGWR